MRKLSYIIICTILILSGINIRSIAQVTASPYSYLGSGLVINNGFGVSKAMGGTGIAFKSGYSLNDLNPASYCGIDSLSFLFEIGTYLKYTSFRNSNETQNKFDGNIQYLAMGFRLNKWWATSLGVTPYNSTGYNITLNNTVEGDANTSYKVTYNGNGGINRFYIANAFSLGKHIAFGINTTYLLGNVIKSETAESVGSFNGYALKKEIHLHSFLFDYGLQLNTNIGKWNYSLGLIYSDKKNLHNYTETSFGSSYDTIESIYTKNTEFMVPKRYGAGIAISRGYKFKIGADYVHEDWSDAQFTNRYLETRDGDKYSIGLQYLPYNSITDYGLKLLYYRIGGYYNQSYMIVDGQPINTMAVTFGVGIPLKKKLTMVNIATEFGQTGTTAKGLVKETYFLFHLNFTLHDIWFQKPRYD